MTMSMLNMPVNAKDVKIMNYINGEFVAPTSGSYLMSYNPATGEEMTPIPDSMAKDVDNAVRAAKNAFPMWSNMPATERAAMLNRIADMIDENCQKLATLESQDQGKPVMMAAMYDMPTCANTFRQFAKYIVDGIMETKSTANVMMTKMSVTKNEPGTMMAVTQHVPAGVAGLITPWNFPMQMVCEKIAPCIAVGNTCVVKPTELTSVTPFVLSQIMDAAGIPAGVVNFVFGTGTNAGEPLVKHKDVRLISFTGGSPTGAKIGAMSGGMYKRVSLELGGKNPSLVFNDSDMNHAVATNVRAAFQNQGEICLCSSRQYVQRDVYDMYLQMFRQMTMEEVVVGDPSNPKTFYGPMVSKQHMEKVMSYIRLAQEEGAKVEFLVNPNNKMIKNVSKDGMLTIKGMEGGYYIAPTLITGMKQSSRLMQEEIFGPVVCVMPFKTEEEAIQLANDTEYGLGASVWTMDKVKMMRVMKQVNAGSVWGNGWYSVDDNMPFGGMGCSGTSREHGPWSLEFYTETKALYYPSMK
ncbi:hypothetical protein LPJ77_002086 [Coemansia sp. RSA 2523]|nr:hypothetical protein LPJ54_001615 [Coemansia sp. RSA 1824]KAJ1785819.1 hypothetical protein LPJ62_004055 [Coemansia sp. RSA 2167]KAJ1808821.1 hypothetical protein LPJ77_002086 [Coemansia sp. RSA 2523]KAJ2132409.1 hypothetical protein GGF48_000945 [Coemansia sp. RSA 921]KAJ2135666.1 hypothetical protein GGH17_002281 [Coemansia sp. RSA 788]KAJ2143304.1 hypothetical protein IW142_003797 [Coemansia sp. RSA 564]KAJ2149783.1 hypothetical protein J3F82_004378 [Coemansia sp. RSA 637]KAJ2189171.1 